MSRSRFLAIALANLILVGVVVVAMAGRGGGVATASIPVIAAAPVASVPPGTEPVTAAAPASPPASTPEPQPAPAPVLVVGDSLTVGAQSAGLEPGLQAAGLDPLIVAEVGRDPAGGLAVIEGLGQVPAKAVVELGTNRSSNPIGFDVQVAAITRALLDRGAQTVVWVTPVFGFDDRYDDKAAILSEVAATIPGMVVADWRPVARAHPEWFRPDGLHYTAEGYAAYAHFLIAAAS